MEILDWMDMEIVLDSIFPVCLIIVLGSLLGRMGLTDNDFFRVSDRLIYFVFFPVMLFWKIGIPSRAETLEWNLGLACAAAVFSVFLLSLLAVKVFKASDFEVGSFSQCCYRFNTYVGMAVILSACGEEGVKRFGIILVFTIPFINVLAVSTLIWFSGKDYTSGEKARFMTKALISNPLIVACVLGFGYSQMGPPFPKFIENSFRLLSSVSLPMALLSIGGSLTFDKLRGHFRLAAVSTGVKLLLLPLAGYLFMRVFNVAGPSLQIGMLYFSLPTSTAIYILSSQLQSDVDLASAGIVLSTVCSLASLSATLLIFR